MAKAHKEALAKYRELKLQTISNKRKYILSIKKDTLNDLKKMFILEQFDIFLMS